jgi:hypothetical protein
VIASGNSSYVDALSSPGCISSAVSVGSTRDGGFSATPVDTISSFSNGASFLSLLAPGQWIESSVPGSFDLLQGTSMATPHVAGAWAVLKQANPSATVSEVLSALQTTGLMVTDTRLGATAGAKPRIQLDAALDAFADVHFAEGPGYSFGPVTIDLSATRQLTLVNTFDVPVDLSSPSLSGSGLTYSGGSFPGTGGTCSLAVDLAANASCTISLTYKPTLVSTLSGSLGLTFDPAGSSPSDTLSIALAGSGVELCTDNLINNAVFEKAGTWSQVDTVGGNALPLCPAGQCTPGALGPAGPLSGAGWAWFGGYTSTVTTTTTVSQTLSQTVTIPGGTASLQFAFRIARADPGTGPSDLFRALIDATPVFTATADEQGDYSGYQILRLDLSSFATGVSHTLTFSATSTSVGPVVNFDVDDAAICSPAFYPVYLPITMR